MTFKALEATNTQRHIIYFGILIVIPCDVAYLATDRTGIVKGFNDMPIIVNDRIWCYTDIDTIPIHLTYIKYEGDWRESLIKVSD